MYNLGKQTIGYPNGELPAFAQSRRADQNDGQIVQIGCFRFIVKQQQAVRLGGDAVKHLVRDTLRPVITEKMVL